jgi:hypothetical protein
MSITAQPSRLWVPFSEKFDSLLDRLDNQRMMHGSRNDALEWAHGIQNDAHYCSCMMLYEP